MRWLWIIYLLSVSFAHLVQIGISIHIWIKLLFLACRSFPFAALTNSREIYWPNYDHKLWFGALLVSVPLSRGWCHRVDCVFLLGMHKLTKAPLGLHWWLRGGWFVGCWRWKNWKVAQSEFPWPQFDTKRFFLVSGLIRMIRIWSRNCYRFDLSGRNEYFYSFSAVTTTVTLTVEVDCIYREDGREWTSFEHVDDWLTLWRRRRCLAIGEGYWRLNYARKWCNRVTARIIKERVWQRNFFLWPIDFWRR